MKDTKQQWFKDAKYGLFIHWGLYSLLAGEYKGEKTDHIAEWIMNYLDIPADEYRKLAAQFTPEAFNAEEIVRKAKEEWGMKYIVFTTKHHEGFAMWNSKCSDYNVVKATPYGQDVLKQLQNACEKYEIKLGLYYSQAQDWDDPNGYRYGKEDAGRDFSKYLYEKCIPQMEELLTEYGKIALIWFDTPMGITKEESQILIDLVKAKQPDCIISGRIGNEMGEYLTTGDNFIPRLPYEGDWEVPATLNDTWGYNKDDNNWKNPDDIIRLLLKIVSRGGNYLLNIGPDGAGRIPGGSLKILDQVGSYVKENAEAIYHTERVAFYPYELEWAQFTRKPNKLFVHVLQPKMRLELLNVANRVTNVYLVKDHSKLSYCARKICEGDSIIEVELSEELRRQKNYAVCIETEEEEPIFEPIRG